MGKRIIANARRRSVTPPPRWPSKLHVLPAPQGRDEPPAQTK